MSLFDGADTAWVIGSEDEEVFLTLPPPSLEGFLFFEFFFLWSISNGTVELNRVASDVGFPPTFVASAEVLTVMSSNRML